LRNDFTKTGVYGGDSLSGVKMRVRKTREAPKLGRRERRAAGGTEREGRVDNDAAVRATTKTEPF
jgi:hypothetical protein